MEKIIISIMLIVVFVLYSNVIKSESKNESTQSIFEYINENLNDEGKLLEEKQDLLSFYEEENEGLKWAPGAMDGVLGHYMGSDNSDEIAKQVALQIKKIAITNKSQDKQKVIELIKKNQVLGWLDKSIEYIIENNTSNTEYLKMFARELAFKSDNIEAVKFGIALIGITRDINSKEKILVLGKHEEFTLYTIVAISNMEENAEKDIWNIAKNVDGWGKINAVERLKNTNSPEIKTWLLIEGYKNSVMYEYLAYISATTGELYSVVKKNNISEKELIAASDLIEALIIGGPAEGIEDYSDGCNVIIEYLEKMKNRRDKAIFLLTVESIFEFVDDKDFPSEDLKKIGWNEDNIKKIHKISFDIINDISWKQLFEEMKGNVTDKNIYELERMSYILKINLHDFYVMRIQNNPNNQFNWYYLMKHTDGTNIDDTIQLAESILNLEEVEGKPSKDLMLGDKYQMFNSLDSVLQDLDKYPKKGKNLIIAGLRSISIRNRNMAVKALKNWDLNEDNEIFSELKKLVVIEPDDELKIEIKKLLKEEK